MAEHFLNHPQDLEDDAELWKFLPSDILPLDHQISSSHHPNEHNCSYLSYKNLWVEQRLSCMSMDDRLSRSFPAFSLIDPRPPPQSFIIPRQNLRRFRPVVQSVCSRSLPVRCFVCNGCQCGDTNQARGFGTGTVWTGDPPVYRYPFMNPNPVQAQAECFTEERSRALLSRHNLTVANRVPENRPFSGGRVSGVDFMRHYGGTGVFLPRIPANVSSASAKSIDHPRRRQGARNRHEEAQLLPPRNSFMNMVQMKKQEDYRNQVSPELGLPEDWTY